MIPRARIDSFRSVYFVALAAIVLNPCPLKAITPLPLGGALEGRVSDDSGLPKMGAAVQLFDRQDKIVGRILTDERGFFSFAGLLPDLYSVRVTLSTFFPAVRNQIRVRAGESSLLDVNLSGLFSSIHLLPPQRDPSASASEEWKWILRSSGGTRPVFRYLPVPADDDQTAAADRVPVHAFTDSRGIVLLSSGDQSTGGPAGQLGTAFAFATTFLGANNIAVAGDLGYGWSAEAPSAAVRVTYGREIGLASPELSLTVRQLYLPQTSTTGDLLGPVPFSGRPPIRTYSASVDQKTQLSDHLALAYGFAADSVSFVDHLHYFSPYARLFASLGSAGTIDFSYSSGNPHPTQLRGKLDPETDPDTVALVDDLAALNATPRLTIENGRSRIERSADFQIGYAVKKDSREYRVSAYREYVRNAALMISGPIPSGFSADLLPDLSSDSVLFNSGNFRTSGYSVSVTQELPGELRVTLAYGSVGVLAPNSETLVSDAPADLRSLMHAGSREAATVRVSGTVPHAGTRFIASYEMMDNQAATAGHLYSAAGDQSIPGLNFDFVQPVPSMFGIPLHMEANVDLQNMLETGYLPISLANGNRLLLVQTPRCVRGGVNFRF